MSRPLSVIAALAVTSALSLPALAQARPSAATPTFPTSAASKNKPVTSATTPTFPTPASAKVQPTTATTGATAPTTVPSSTSVSGAPATTKPASTPTTATTAPAATVPPASPSAAAPSNFGAYARAHPRARSATSGKVSTEAIVLAAIAVLLLLACTTWALARSRAFEPRWLLSLRHAMAEAGFRMSATWAEFADWARLGR